MGNSVSMAISTKGIGIKLSDAIENRRSIRKFLPKEIPEDIIMEIIRAAQLAPSGCNVQPWRFKIIRDKEIKQQLATEATFYHPFIADAPVVLVCCADVKKYKEKNLSGVEYLWGIEAISQTNADIASRFIQSIPDESPILWIHLALNVGIAIEHIVLKALDFELGTCWIGGFIPDKVKDICKLDDSLFVVAILPIGFPAESPKPRNRIPIQDILL